MSDPPTPPSPDPDSAGIPSQRAPGDLPRTPEEPPAGQISLEEMMQRLQRSSESRSGESRSGESRSGRRRRSSSSSSSGRSHRGTSGHSSSRHPSSSYEEASQDDPPAPGNSLPRGRTVLPPPRRPLDSAATADLPMNRAARAAAAPGRRRRWWIFLGLLILLLLGGWIGVRLLNRWRIERDGFQVNVARRLSELAGRKVSLSRFQQSGTNELSNASLTVAPDHRDLVGTAAFGSLSAEFTPGSWLADDWVIRSLRIRRAEIAFQPVKELNLYQNVPSPVERELSRSQGFRLSMTSDPASVVLESGRLDGLDLTWPGPGGAPESLLHLQGNFHLTDQNLQMELSDGLLDTANWPPLPVRQVKARLTGTTLHIISARLGFTAEHEVRVTGKAELTPTGGLELAADITPVLLRHLLPDVWTSRVNGTFESSKAVWQSHFAPDQPGQVLSGPFRVKGLVLRGLPFVDKIANLLRRPELAIMEFPTCSGNFTWTPKETRLTDLSASLNGDLLRLRGAMTVVPGESIAGTLTFEANEAYFAGADAAAAGLFTPGPEGYRSLTVTLSGTAPSITDDIGIATPVILSNPPSVLERSGPGVPPAAARPPTGSTAPAAPAVPAAPPAAPPRQQRPPLPPPPVKPPPSDAELERSFNDLIGR